jgi:hypothetical protein
MKMQKLFSIVLLDTMDRMGITLTGAQHMLQMKWGVKSMKVTAPKPTKEEFPSVGACEPSLLERISLLMRTRK